MPESLADRPGRPARRDELAQLLRVLGVRPRTRCPRRGPRCSRGRSRCRSRGSACARPRRACTGECRRRGRAPCAAATLIERNPEPTGVVVGPLIADLVALDRLERAVRERVALLARRRPRRRAARPTRTRRRSPRSTRRVASASSGPVPSPGMKVTSCAIRRAAMLSTRPRMRLPSGAGRIVGPMAIVEPHRTTRTDPRGHQPGAAARGLQRLRAGHGRWSRRSSARAADWAARARPASSGAIAAAASAIELGRAGEREPADAAHARPLRQPDRRGRVPPRLARAAAAWRSRTGCTRCRGRPEAGRPRGAGGDVHRPLGRPRPGVGCPISMTYSVIPALRKQPELAERVGAAASRRLTYDPSGSCPAPDKAGALCGMAMTEKQGGSDVRANTTVARPLNGGGAGRRVRDHRAQVVLLGADVRRVPGARAGRRGPLVLPAAARSCPTARATASTSSASRTSSATARTPPARSSSAAPGRGSSARRAAASRRSSRWSTTRGSTACSAPAPGCAGRTREATHHASHRSAFGKPLIDQPLMRNVLADLCVESEAATITRHAAGARLRRGPRRRRAGRGALQRLATAVLKYWICKRAPVHAVEALECLGGNGYVEESGMPRLYRESAAGLDLGGLGQRHVPRRAARDGQEPRARSRPSSPRSTRRAGAEPPPRRRRSPSFASGARRPRGRSKPGRAGSSSGWRWRSRARFWCATATRPSPTRSAPRGSAATPGRAFGTLPAGVDFGRIIERHAPAV